MLAGCTTTPHQAAPPSPPVAPAALDTLLLKPAEIDAVLGTAGISPQPTIADMNDHRDVVTNLNCLGVWQSDEAAVYENTGWNGLRSQTLRSPDTDVWNDLVVQSVVSYPSAGAARTFFAQSSDRWSACVNHRLSIAVSGQPSRWQSGDLTKNDTELTMPVTRQGGDQVRSCQRILAMKDNVIIDTEACKPQPVASADAIVRQIETKFPQ
jgi:serine/threonine-protein kinase